MRWRVVVLGVPKLGIIKELYDLDDPASVSALDQTVANGCTLLNHREATQDEVTQWRKQGSLTG